jgi:uncharacterized low-complexity protein
MKTERKSSVLKRAVLSGMIAGALPLAGNAENLMNYDIMGSGSEIRSDLLNQYGSSIDGVSNEQSDYIVGEAKCGEGKCGGDSGKEVEGSEAKSAKEGKTSEATCGKKSKKEEGKTTEAKCGENTCGGAE